MGHLKKEDTKLQYLEDREIGVDLERFDFGVEWQIWSKYIT